MKYHFELSIVVAASSQEDALRQISAYVATAARHVGNERALGDTGAFTLNRVKDDSEVDDVRTDPITEEHGAYPVMKPDTDGEEIQGEVLPSPLAARVERAPADGGITGDVGLLDSDGRLR